ncbi:MAG: hypothetical protein Satyrvirus1_12 [Satyrvirus sp.]|uniref:SET domain-containing protein n=1 Tax=Satyrvirus sp. TaxID=2487771 RepID=A0A3G5ACI5_9VIRU|nr:MAG: hypothetical protein Satyrvirus1_12 [Satyrvirus sp.]
MLPREEPPSTLSSELEMKIWKNTSVKDQIHVEETRLETKKSTIKNIGIGIFALEFIPKDTIFMYGGDRSSMSHVVQCINDLAYHGNSINYENNENIIEHINVGYLRQVDDLFLGGGFGKCDVYLYALRDIQVGEELSRYYGLRYWQNEERKELSKQHANHK